MKTSANSAPVVIDWDNDGLLDILTGDEGSKPSKILPPLFFKNTGTKTKPAFADAVKMTADNKVIADAERFNIDVADLNYDGKLDLIIGAGWTPGEAYFYENTGTPSSPVLKKYVKLQDNSGSNLSFRLDLKVYVTDWNEDGGLDLLLGHLEASDGIDFYQGQIPPPTAILSDRTPISSFMHVITERYNGITAVVKSDRSGTARLRISNAQGAALASMFSPVKQNETTEFSLNNYTTANGFYFLEYSVDGIKLVVQKIPVFR